MGSQTGSSYAPLHLHSEFSLLDGGSRIADVCKKAAEHNMPGIALTDHGTMYGVFQLVQEAKKHGVKPIVGCEVYVINGDHTEKGKENRKKLYHLVLLAKNDVGYRNLIKICTESCVNGFYYKPRISKDFIRKHSEGLIALSACLGGEVNNNLLTRASDEAVDLVLEYKEIFGEDFYLEIQDHLYPEDRIVNPKILELASQLGVKVVATNDSHYTNREDAMAHDALLCLQTQKYISDFPRMHFSGHEHLKTQEEMLSMFKDHLSEDVIRAAVLDVPQEICDKVTDSYEVFDKPSMHMPNPGLPEDHSDESYLREITYAGAVDRFGDLDKLEADHKQEIIDRLETELKIMNDSGFASYFIVVWDFIKWAREHDIPVGPGRGSAAGSLVAFCLGITNIDPLKYGLLFERFLNPERKSMPDIDTDFCIERREEVIEYVREKYGEENVAQIITFNKMTSRAVLRDMARVLEYPYSKAEQLAKMIPVVRGKPRTIAWMLENHDDFQRTYRTDPGAKEVIELSMKNEGINKTFGVHAAGVVISDAPITEVIPLSKNNDGSIITQFAMDECAHMGLLKMDFLGLRNLTMIKRAIDIIYENQVQELKSKGDDPGSVSRIDIDNIPLDDEKTFATIAAGNLSGIFQLETSSGMKQVARDLNPESLEDISALIALYRPGPLDTGMIDDFINCKSGKKQIRYEHELLEPLLKNTYGTIVYQEQIMQIAQVLAGFSLGEADMLRRAMGKKKPEVLLPFKDKFLAGCKERGISEALALKLFDQMMAFAEYCFNKSHSTAYGMITYQTAYLKTHYPVEYLTSLFVATGGDTDKIKFYINEAERLGINVSPPNVNESGVDFSAKVSDRTIVFGLGAIKGVGSVPASEIVQERDLNGPFQDFADFIKRLDPKVVNKRTLESLIKSGALDSLGAGRKAMVENMPSFMEFAKKKRSEEEKGQGSLFSMLGSEESSEGGSAAVDFGPSFANGADEEYEEREMQKMEYELLGLYVNNHPMSDLKIAELTEIVSKNNISQFENLPDGAKVAFTGLLTELNKKLTKKNKVIAILNLEDLEARCEGVVFSNKMDALEPLMEEGKCFLIEGTLSKRLEGVSSVMIDSITDLDEMGLMEFDVDISKIDDSFQMFHEIRKVIVEPQNQGSTRVVLNIRDGDELKKISFGSQFSVYDTHFVKDKIQEIINRYSGIASEAVAV